MRGIFQFFNLRWLEKASKLLSFNFLLHFLFSSSVCSCLALKDSIDKYIVRCTWIRAILQFHKNNVHHANLRTIISQATTRKYYLISFLLRTCIIFTLLSFDEASAPLLCYDNFSSRLKVARTLKRMLATINDMLESFSQSE